MARRPTPKQARLMVRIANGEVTATRRDDGDITFRAAATGYGSTPAAVTAAVKPLIVNGWADIPFAESGRVGGAVTLTVGGAQALSDAQTLAEFAALPDVADWFNLVRVARRHRGNSPIRGGGKVPDGREIRCTPCNRAARSAGRMALEVWYTNEGGRDADREAEIARAVHVLRHVHGELPTPTHESTETTP